MVSFSRIHLVLAVAGVLLAAGCQSAEQRQAQELREFLRGKVGDLEPHNDKVLQEKQKLYDLDNTSPWGNVEETRERYSAELAELRRRVEEYPDLELTSLANEIRTLIKRREQDAQSVARARRRKESFRRIDAMYKRNEARNREALRPKIIVGGETKIVE